MEKKIEKLTEKSKEVFSDCLLPNGCLVAAPSHMPYYPRYAKSYLYCWPGRDLGYNISAALILGIDAFDKVLTWIWERAEGFSKNGLLYKTYHPNGLKFETGLQADQTGTLIWAIGEYSKVHKLSDLHLKILKKSAEGLSKIWQKDHFKVPIEDLWEERISHPRFRSNLTYSLAACSAGLMIASEILANKIYKDKAEQMKYQIDKKAYDNNQGFFVRRFGRFIPNDLNLDVSVLALLWPFEIVKSNDPQIISTIEKIEQNLVDEHGVHRYQFDEYEGELADTIHLKHGGGSWPICTSWLSIVLSKMGHKKKAEKYFTLVIDRVGPDLLIPEQFFDKKDPRIGVKPLLWSHMMFVHAAKELEYI